MTIRVLIADDHQVVRQGMRMFLSLDEEIEIVAEAKDGREAVALARQHRPDVVLMDLLMPGMDGIAATAEIRSELEEIQVVALTSALDDERVIGAVRAGALGYLLKDTEPDELVRAIRLAAAGEVHLSPQAAERLMRRVRAPETPESLTDREVEVLRLIARGRSNKQIASDLFLSEKTVKTHVSHILAKLNLLSRTQAALFAVRAGLVSVDEANSVEP